MSGGADAGGSAPATPISKNKWGKLKAGTPSPNRAPNWKTTEVSLEYCYNPSTKEYTDKMRLGATLKAGLKNPKGIIQDAWGSACLQEQIQ